MATVHESLSSLTLSSSSSSLPSLSQSLTLSSLTLTLSSLLTLTLLTLTQEGSFLFCVESFLTSFFACLGCRHVRAGR